MVILISLDGEWQTVCDADNRGVAESWGAQGIPAPLPRTPMTVPSVWNVVQGLYTGAMFYERSVGLPDVGPGGRLVLRFEAVNHTTEVWLGGQYLGCHVGGYLPFEFDVTPWAGQEQSLRVRVVDYPKNGEFGGCRQQETACAKESWYYTYGGIYGSVSLCVRPPVHVDAQVISADPNTGEVRLRGQCHNAAETPEVTLELKVVHAASGESVAREMRRLATPGVLTDFECTIKVEAPQAWSPDSPTLYTIRLRANEQAPEAALSIRFGFRSCALRAGRFMFNGHPLVIKGALLQPNYPVSLVVPTDPEMARREIRLLKDAGFNLVRSHVRPADPRYLDLCDEMGLLVHQETACGWIEGTPRGNQACRDEIGALFARDQHHACIVMWGILNENFKMSEDQRLALLRLAKTLDPTRPCIDDSGISAATSWERLVWVDQSWSVGPGVDVPEPLEDHHHYPPVPLPPGWYQWLQQLGDGRALAENACLGHCGGWRDRLYGRMAKHPEAAIFVSEFGYGSFPDYDSVIDGYSEFPSHPECVDYRKYRDVVYAAIVAAGLDRPLTIRQSQRVQGQGLLRMIEAMRSNPQISGYIVTQLNDAAWEHFAGILDAWRQPKGCYPYIQEANRELLLMVDGYTPVHYADREQAVTVKAVNDTSIEGPARIEMRLVDAGGRSVWNAMGDVPLQAGIQTLGCFVVPPVEAGGHVLRIDLHCGPDRMWQREEAWIAAAPTRDGRGAAQVCVVGAGPALRARIAGVLGEARITDAPAQAGVILLCGLPVEDATAWQEWADRCRAGATVVVLNHEPHEAMLQTVNVPFEGLHDHDFPCEGISEALGVPVLLRSAHGFFMSNSHYLHVDRLTEGLPAAELLDERFAGVTASYGMVAPAGSEIIGGALCQRKFADVELAVAGTLVRMALGAGVWIFCQLRLCENLGQHPYADQLLLNLLRQER